MLNPVHFQGRAEGWKSSVMAAALSKHFSPLHSDFFFPPSEGNSAQINTRPGNAGFLQIGRHFLLEKLPISCIPELGLFFTAF